MSTDAEILGFPDVRSGAAGANANAQVPAPTRARPREKARRLPSGTAVAGVLSGASIIDRPPPAIMTIWAKHAASARFYDSEALIVTWLLRWPRFAFGAWHAFVEVPILYFLAWSGDSIPKRLAVVAVVLAILRLLGVHVIWSWL